MRQSTTLDINGTTYTIHELTVGEIDAVIGSINTDGPLHRTYNVIGFDITPEFVTAASGINDEEHANFSVSELDDLVAKVEEVNASFLERVRAKAAKTSGASGQ